MKRLFSFFGFRSQRSPRSRRSAVRSHGEHLEQRLVLSTYSVLTTADSGLGSFRQAILDANANVGADTIAFNIGGGGAQTIAIVSALPAITGALTIAGATQPGFAGSSLITVDSAGVSSAALRVQTSNCVIGNLIIRNASGIGVGVNGATNTLLHDLDLSWTGTGRVGTGVAVGGSSNTKLENVAVRNRSLGLDIVGDAGLQISGTDFNNANEGVKLRSTTGLTLQGPLGVGLGTVAANALILGDMHNTVIRDVDLSWTGTGRIGVGLLVGGGSSNTTLENVAVRNRFLGMDIAGDVGIQISDADFNNASGGLKLRSMTGVTLQGPIGVGLGTIIGSALELQDVDNATIRDLDLSWTGAGRVGVGLLVGGGSSNTTVENVAVRNRFLGMNIWGDAAVEITDADFNNANQGLQLRDMTGVSLQGPIGVGLGTVTATALELQNVDDATIRDLDLSWTGAGRVGTGLAVGGGSSNTALENVAVRNRNLGMDIVGDAGIQISDADFNNANRGLQLRSMAGVTLQGPIGDGFGTVITTALELHDVDNATIRDLDLSWTGAGRVGTGLSIHTGSSNVAVEHIFAGNRTRGVNVSGSTNIEVSCSSLQDNATGFSADATSSQITLDDNQIEGNSVGVANAAAAILMAENNYWGSSNGPSNLGGSGDSYSGNVDADPFLGSLPDCLVVNQPPIATDDEVATDEDTPLLFNVLGDNGHGPDEDADGNIDPSLTTALTSPPPGALTNNGNGTFTYDPGIAFQNLAVGESATVTFDYRIFDAFGEHDDGTVTITIHGVNDTPVADDVPTTVIPQLLVNSGFETVETITGGTGSLTTTGNWAGDVSNIVTAQNGITPAAGSRMLRFDSTQPTTPAGVGNAGEVLQLVSLTPYASAIAAGNFTLELSALFNRVAGDSQTDRRFEVNIFAYDGPLSSFPTQLTNLTHLLRTNSVIDTDGNTSTWQSATTIMDVPVGTDFVAVLIAARENIFNDATPPEFDGHYADSVRLRAYAGGFLTTTETGPPITAAFDADDPDTDDSPSTLTYTVTLPPSGGSVINHGNGTFSFDPENDFAFLAAGQSQLVTFDYVATDSHGAVSNTATVSVLVTGLNNSPPIARNDDVSTDEENSLLINVLADNGHGADTDVDGNRDPSLTIALTSPAAGELTNHHNGSFTFDPSDDFESLAVGESAQVSFDYQIEDAFGETSSATVTIAVSGVNDDPVVANAGNVTVNEGQTAANSGIWSDVDASDVVSLSASVGSVTKNANGTWNWTFNSSDGPDQSQTVVITANDGHGGIVTSHFELTVNNVAPAVANIGIVSVNEGQTAANSGTWSDPGADVVTLTASIGNVVKNTDGTWNWTFNTSDGPDQSQTVTITATDSDGASTQTTFNLTVTNVAPAVANIGNVSVNEGQAAANSGTWSDPGADVVTLTASIGNVVKNTDGTWNWSFNTSDGPDQSQTVTITATDSDGASTQTTFNLTVNNVAPTFTSVVSSHTHCCDSSLDGTVSVSGAFTDPGLDTHTVTVNWGDGTISNALVDQIGDTFVGSHVYASGGLFTVTFTVIDSDGAVSELRTAQAVVQGVGLVDGVLYVIGSDGKDRIHLRVYEHRNRVSVDAHLGIGHRHHDESERFRATFLASSVDLIVVDACGGDDHIHIGGGSDSESDCEDDDPEINISTSIMGGAGNDHIHGGQGNDIIDGGEGDDHIHGRRGDDAIVDLSGNNKIHAGFGDDTITTGTGDDDIDGNQGDDVIVAGDGRNRVDGGLGNDIIVSGSGNDALDGNQGHDVISGGAGDDRIDGGLGEDVLIGGNGGDQVSGSQNDDLLIAGAAANQESVAALESVLASWLGDDLSAALLGLGTISDDGDKDDLKGDQGNDHLVGGIGDKLKQ